MSSQIVMISTAKKTKSALPLVFTEHGVTMLSNILKSKRARRTNVSIVRAFIALKQYAMSHNDLIDKSGILESKYNKQFKDIYEAINYLLQKDIIEKAQQERKRIGYK